MAQIKKLEDIVGPVLGNDKQILGTEIGNLTIAGDNYGSSMLKVDIKVKNKNETETVHAVAKTLPQNEFIRKMFNSSFTFRNEVGFYEKIAPLLRDFQKERGLTELYDSFPAFYGARLSLDPESTEPDDDGVLLIKNIKYDGFGNIDRRVGFDMDQTKLILDKIAELHGTFMAFKKQKPEIFDKEISQFFKQYKIFDLDDGNDTSNQVVQSMLDLIKDDPFCKQHLDKIKNILESTVQNNSFKNKEESSENLFASLVHSDMWINNIMVKIIDGKTVDVKFVDYQIYEYTSLTRDVVVFLFTSVQLQVLKDHLDDFLQIYYNNLISWLKKLSYDVSGYSFDSFMENMKTNLWEKEFFHIMIMMGPIYAQDQNTKGVEEMNKEALVEQRRSVSEQCKEKTCFIVKELLSRGWL